LSGISQGGVLLSIKKLEKFRGISSLMIPGCFGGFNKDDVVCEKFCGRAHTGDLISRALRIREKIGIEPRCTFFGDEIATRSCQMKRLEIELELVEAKKKMDAETVLGLEKKIKWLDDIRAWNQKARLYEEKKLPDDPKLKELAKELKVESREGITVVIESK